MHSPLPAIDQAQEACLSPFRRRIRLLRAWRCAAIGGAVGAVGSTLLILADYETPLSLPRWAPAAVVALGMIGGVIRAIFEPLPAAIVARSVDRRGRLADRLTSAAEISVQDGLLAPALHTDAVSQAGALNPSALYPLRLSRPHAYLAGFLLIAALCYLATNTTLFKSAQAKIDAAKDRQAAAGIEHITRPFLQDAQQPGATPQEKELADELRRFDQDLQRGRMSRQQALVRANQLAEEAKRLTMPHSLALAQRVSSAQTAADKLAQMAQAASMQKSQDAQMAEKAAALTQQIASLEQQLAQGASGKKALTPAERAALEKQLAAAQKALQAIRLSEQARQFLEKLESMPDFKEAQAILAKLAAQAAAQQSGEQPEMSPEQMKAMAERLEQLAKEFGSDAQMKELAQQMLEAAKEAQLARNGQLPTNLLQLFGINTQQPGFGLKGRGGTNPGVWMGGIGHLDKTDKSSLLKVKFKDRVITSQMGPNGPASYTEFSGPSAMGDRSSIPYQAVLPTYQKMAETALSKSDIPARERVRVRDYFNSLRK